METKFNYPVFLPKVTTLPAVGAAHCVFAPKSDDSFYFKSSSLGETLLLDYKHVAPVITFVDVLPTEGQVVGDRYIYTATNTIREWNGTSWQIIFNYGIIPTIVWVENANTSLGTKRGFHKNTASGWVYLSANYEDLVLSVGNSNAATIAVNLITPRYERINLNSGTGSLIMSFTYPTVIKEKTLIINNSRGTDVDVIFPTANVTDSGITYVFHKSVNSITIPNEYSAEVDFLCFFIDSTNCEIRIVANNFNYKSS